MGSVSSKTASSAAKAASKVSSTPARKYPTRPAPSHSTQDQARSPTERQIGPIVHPQASDSKGASETKGTEVELDAQDPDINHGLAARLSQLGPVDPQAAYSPSPSQPSSSGFQPSASSPSQSIFPQARQNPAVSLLTARYRLAEEAEFEFSNVGRKSAVGRQFLDVVLLRQVLVLREKGVSGSEIERQLGLREGVVGRLGRHGVVEACG